MIELTQGTLLGGRIHYAQPRTGYYRTGIEPVLLAAAIPAQPGQRILEAGIGAGAALLCLLYRQPGAIGIGLELDPTMADIARRNATANHLPLTIQTADVNTAPTHAPIHHACANPPWHQAGTPPATPAKARAKHADSQGLAPWIEALAAALAPLDQDATLTLILPAAQIPAAIIHATRAGLPQTLVYPLWPRAGRPAKLALLQARQGPATNHEAAGLILHTPTGAYTEEAEAILREGQPINLPSERPPA